MTDMDSKCECDGREPFRNKANSENLCYKQNLDVRLYIIVGLYVILCSWSTMLVWGDCDNSHDRLSDNIERGVGMSDSYSHVTLIAWSWSELMCLCE